MIISNVFRCWRRSLVWGVLGLAVSFAEAQFTTPTTSTPDPPIIPTIATAATATTSSASVLPTSYFASIWTMPQSVVLNSLANFSYSVRDIQLNDVQLILCRTTASLNELPTPDEVYVVEVLPVCQSFETTNEQTCSIVNNIGNVSYEFETGSQYNKHFLSNFFFCIGTNFTDYSVCESYSAYFDIDTIDIGTPNKRFEARALAASPPLVIQNIMTIPAAQTQPLVTVATQASTTISLTTATPSATASSSTSATATASTTATIGTTISTAKSSSHGLSVGAKVGIALGALILAFLLLLLALFFLRRKHAQRNLAPVHSHSLHTDSFPHSALITEKDEHSRAAIATEPILDPPLIHRHPGTHIPYTAVPNNHNSSSNTSPSSYTAPAPLLSNPNAHSNSPPNTYPTGVPKRKPTANTVASTISRGLSTISRSSGPRPSTGSSGGNFESYRDRDLGSSTPIYGDARSSPQVFTTSEALREEGMTAEEVARLEEEERRIDAAIAEAERR